jgi:flagellar motility protein MotE (MotC chaperone)
MIRILRDFRIIPIVLVAVTGLFVLKSLGLVFDGGYLFADGTRSSADVDITGTIGNRPSSEQVPAPSVAEAKPAPTSHRSWAQEVFNFPEVTGSIGQSGSKPKTAETKAKSKTNAAKAKDPPKGPNGKLIPIDGGRVPSPAERAILERLSERRAELDARAREIDMRENLIKAAEKRLEARVAKLKQLEQRINGAVQEKDKAEATRIKAVVTMYENMKAKDAARIFDRLDMRVLIEVAAKINPRRMSDILAQMSSQAAERLTIALASRAKDKAPAKLPKINGRLTAN